MNGNYPKTINTSGNVSTEPAPAREPGLLLRCRQIQNVVADLDQEMAQLDFVLFGKQSAAHTLGDPGKAESIDSILADVSTRVACLVGHARTINSLVHYQPPETTSLNQGR